MTETVRALTCPNCGGTIGLRAAGVSVTLVCEHCGAMLDATREDVRAIAAAGAAMRVPPIALGTRGTLSGVQWEVVGYLERTDGWADWSEYLLFNPYEGYAFLIDDGRRFSLGRLLDRTPEWSWQGLALDGRCFRRFGDTYEAKVTFVVGEFYWRVRVGETVKATDYVRPGTMLACEESGAERTWTRVAMLDRGVAERAFGLDPRPREWGGTPSPHEPSPYLALLWEAGIIAFATFVALLVIATAGGGGQRLARGEIAVPLAAATAAGGEAATASLGPIALRARYNRVRIRAEAPGLDNAWAELDYTLVARDTQASYPAYATAERYSGYDSDGPWTEGDRSPTVDLASVPAGIYDLVVEASAQRWKAFDPGWGMQAPRETVPVTIIVASGGAFVGNIPFALLFVAIWPAMLLALHIGHERRRMAPVSE